MPRQPYGHPPQIKLTPEGAIQNERIERYALLLADDIHRATAWKALGGKIEGGSAAYRLQCEKDPLFQKRMAALKLEKETCMADELYGEAKWMAQQLWREGRATGNTTMTMKALDARMKIMEREDARRPQENTPDGVKGQNRPGKPVTENPQTSTGMEAIRQKLIEAGAPVPGADPVSDGKAASNPVAKSDAPVSPPMAMGEMPPPVDFQAQLDRLLPG